MPDRPSCAAAKHYRWLPAPELGRPRHRTGHPLGHDRVFITLEEPITRLEFLRLIGDFFANDLRLIAESVLKMGRFALTTARMQSQRRRRNNQAPSPAT